MNKNDAINEILANWNPLDIPSFIAKEEYKPYINEIISKKDNPDKLKVYLYQLLIENFGLDDKTREKMKLDIENIVAMIQRIPD